MKKFKALIVAFVLAGMTVVSCSSDDSGPAATIEGKWNLSKTVTKVGSAGSQTQNYTGNEANCEKDYIEFMGVASGSLRDVILYTDAQDVCQEDEGTAGAWVKSDSMLTILGGEYEGNYEITKLSNSELRIESSTTLGGQNLVLTYYFKKAS